MRIRAAKIQDIPEIIEVTKACAAYLIDNGIFQWNDQYPTEAAFIKDISRSELYVLLDGDRIIGMITITTLIDEEYKPVKWLTKNANSVYIHRLAVHPKYQGKGNARRLMDYAEKYAVQRGFDSVRLDTFSKNSRNQRFYEERGYVRLEDVYFQNQSEDPFHCYELLL